MSALRYVALNPVRAGLVARPEDWRWSSIHAQLGRVDSDGVTDTAPVRERYPDFAALLAGAAADDTDADGFKALRQAESIGRPLGDAGFLDRLEALTGRRLKRQKPGRKPAKDALSL